MESPDDHGSAIPEPEAYALLNSFTEFLTIAIHSLLFHRGLYPPATFLAARAYNLPVHQSRHPRVCAWINDAVAAVTTQLRLGNARRVVLVVHGLPPRLDVLERWVFDVAMFPAWGGGGDEDEDEGGNDADTAVAAAAEQKHREGGQHQGIIDEEELSGDEDDPQTVVNWTDVNEALRGALRRVAYAGESIPRLPEGCTFTLALELRDQAEAPIGVSYILPLPHQTRDKTSNPMANPHSLFAANVIKPSVSPAPTTLDPSSGQHPARYPSSSRPGFIPAPIYYQTHPIRAGWPVIL